MAESSGSKSAANGVGMEVNFTRVFDAPRELVFKAWTDPKHVAQWWGPIGLRIRAANWTCGPAALYGLICADPMARCIR